MLALLLVPSAYCDIQVSQIRRRIAQFADETSSSRETGAICRLNAQIISVQTTCFCREGVCPFVMRMAGI